MILDETDKAYTWLTERISSYTKRYGKHPLSGLDSATLNTVAWLMAEWAEVKEVEKSRISVAASKA